MPTPLVVAAAVLMTQPGAPAAATEASGNGALALAALVGLASPAIPAGDRRVLAAMLDDRLGFGAPPGHKIVVRAKAVTCRAGDVDIAAHDCTLDFGTTTKKLKGRAAHELYATLLENRAPTDGAAGSIYAALSMLDCTVDPAEVKQRDGGGATCHFGPAP